MCSGLKHTTVVIRMLVVNRDYVHLIVQDTSLILFIVFVVYSACSLSLSRSHDYNVCRMPASESDLEEIKTPEMQYVGQ